MEEKIEITFEEFAKHAEEIIKNCENDTVRVGEALMYAMLAKRLFIEKE